MNAQKLLKKSLKNFTRPQLDFLNSTFYQQCGLAGLLRFDMTKGEELKTVADFTGVNERTVRRWFDGEPAHPSAIMLLLYAYTGFPQQGIWSGWQLTPDYLLSPTGEKVTPRMVAVLWQWRIERQSMQSRIAELEREKRRFANASRIETMNKVEQASKLLAEVVNFKGYPGEAMTA